MTYSSTIAADGTIGLYEHTVLELPGGAGHRPAGPARSLLEEAAGESKSLIPQAVLSGFCSGRQLRPVAWTAGDCITAETVAS